MENNKILHITTAHKNDDVRIFQKEVISLKKAGFDVSLIAQGDLDKQISGINVYAVPFSKNRFDRFLFTNVKILLRVIKINPGICHFHDPDFILGGFILRLLGKRVIYDVHEDVPKQIMSKYWIPKFFRKFISILFNSFEKFISKLFFISIITATPEIAGYFPWKKTSVIMNYPILDEFNNISEYSNKEMSVIYIGALSINRGINEVITALENIENKEIKFYIAGNFENKKIKEEILNRIENNNNIIYLGFLNRGDISKYLSKSKIGIVTLYPLDNYIESHPVKLFEYMAMGLPVIASNFPKWKDIIEKNECGLVVDPLDSNKIKDSINWLLCNPDKAEIFGKNGFDIVREKFNWNIEEQKLIGLYRELINEN